MTRNQLSLFRETTAPRVTGLYAAPVCLLPLLDEIPMAVALLTPERRVVAINRAAEALTGYTREEIRGAPCMYVFRGNYCVSGCPLLGMGAESGLMSLEGDVLTRERRKIPVRATFAPVVDTAGRLAGYLETLEDLRLIRELSARQAQAFGFSHIIGNSPRMERIFQILPGIAQTDSPVLITGETGTGKDVLAEAIHKASRRAKGPFVKVNCGALPEPLLESELFGHGKGAFTCAEENRPGRFRMAQGGTLFLTEIGDLPLPLQGKLLTFLDNHIIYPVGSSRGAQVDVRVIAATHRDLEHMVAEGRFRQDLFFRLNVVHLPLPPLRERGDDVRLLLDHFLGSIAAQFGKAVSGFSEEALKLLTGHAYPGNVRELRNIVEYAVNVCPGERIRSAHLPAYITEAPARSAVRSEPVPVAETQVVQPVSAPASAAGGSTHVHPAVGESWPDVEHRMILDALVRAGGRRSKAAEILGWGRSTLWRKMKSYGMDEHHG